MSQIVEAESLDATQSFARAVECWQQSDTLFKRSGDLFAEAEALRKNSLVQILEMSRLLCEAFKACKGEWAHLFRDPSLPAGFSKANCDRLRLIWDNETLRKALTDSAVLRKLPPAKFTLATLARIPADTLQTYLGANLVHPKLTETAADRLRRNGPTDPRELPSVEVVRRALKGVQRQLAKTEPAIAIAKLVRQVVEEMFPEVTA